MDIHPKFIIEIDEECGKYILIGKSTYHKELAHDITKVIGGGWWEMSKDHKTITLYGESAEFGQAELDDIRECIKNKNVYTNPSCIHSIADSHVFKYKNGKETINLN